MVKGYGAKKNKKEKKKYCPKKEGRKKKISYADRNRSAAVVKVVGTQVDTAPPF